MNFSHHSNYDNASTSYLNEGAHYPDPDSKPPYLDEEADVNYHYPPQRPPVYPLSTQTKSIYTDPDDDGEFTTSQQALRPPPAAVAAQRSCLTRYLPNSLACRLYLLVVLLQTAVDVAIQADILIQFDDLNTNSNATPNKASNATLRTIPVYLGIFALAHVFQFILAIDAVIFRNTLQFIFLVIFNTLLLIYAGLQIIEIRAIFSPTQVGVFSKVPIRVLTDIIPIVIGVSELAYIGLGWKIYTEFGWQVYKLLGADRRIKKMYAQYQIFESLLKFDVFFWLGFSIQFIGLVLSHADFEFGLTIAALPLSMLLLLEGHLAAKHENKWMMWSFLVGLIAGFAYFTYKLVALILRRNEEPYRTVAKSLGIFTAISLVLIVITFIWSVMVMLNFDRGLKQQLAKGKDKKKARRTAGPDGRSGYSMSSHPHRMSIE